MLLSVIFNHILQTVRQEPFKMRLQSFDLKDKKVPVQDLGLGTGSYWNLRPSTGGETSKLFA